MRPSCLLFLLAATALCAGCEPEKIGRKLPVDGFPFPTGLAVHPDGFALVASSNFDLTYENGSLVAVDLNGLWAEIKSGDPLKGAPGHRQFVVQSASAGLPNFAATVALSPDGKVALVAVRETDEIVLVDLSFSSGSIALDCWSSGTRPAGAFPQCDVELQCSENTQSGVKPRCCGGRHRFSCSEEKQQADGVSSSVFLSDPFDILFLRGGGEPYTAYVSFLRSKNLLALDIPSIGDIPRPLFLKETTASGLSGIAYSPKTGYLFAGSRFAPLMTNPIFYFDAHLGDKAGVHYFDLYPDLLGAETRSIAFAGDAGDETTAGLLVLNPDALAIFDTQIEGGLPANRFLDAVILDSNPSRLKADGKYFYATGSKDDTIYVVDSKSRRMVAALTEVCRGPYEMAFWSPPPEDPLPKRLALVTCFEDHVLAVLNADPATPGFLEVLARVGGL